VVRLRQKCFLVYRGRRQILWTEGTIPGPTSWVATFRRTWQASRENARRLCL